MNTIEFLQKILPSQGLYVLAEFRDGMGPNKHPKQTHHCGVLALCESIKVADARGYEVFHACASFIEARKTKMRVPNNVHSTRSQWLDIDVGDAPNKYPSQLEAGRALATLCKSTLHVPLPMLLRSGRGLHAYWCFNRDLTYDEAVQMGQATQGALGALGFMHDPVRTADVVSILRPVGTHWRKAGKDNAVEVALARDAEPIDPALLLHAMLKHAPIAPAPAAPLDEDDEWGTGPRTFPPSSARQVIEYCGALREIAVAGGDVPEPAWRAMLGVVKHCVEGDALAHAWSRGHEQYNRRETQEKLDRWGAGPTTCAQFARLSTACVTCPHKVKSPIMLGYIAPEIVVPEASSEAPQLPSVEHAPDSEPEGPPIVNLLDYADRLPDDLPFWPKGYRWDGAFLSKLLPGASENDPPTWVNFCNKLFYPYMRYRQEDNSWSSMCCALIHPDTARWRHFEIDAQCAADNAPLAGALAAYEIFSIGKGGKTLTRLYMQDMIRGMQHGHIETAMYDSFGWHDGGMVMGNSKITAKGRLPVLLGHRIPEYLRHDFGQAGTAEGWSEVIDDVYNRPGAEPFQFVICAAFAAPLVKLNRTDMWHGIPIALTGSGGMGKTTICKVACSIFGAPQHFTLNANEDGATMNALISRVAIMRNLPLVLDEITGREPHQLQGLLYSLSAGQPKIRLQADGATIDPGLAWDTISFVTGNAGIMNLLSRLEGPTAEATQMRCFEIALSPRFADQVFSGVNAKKRLEHDLLGAQYGVVGEAYLRYVLRNEKAITRLLQSSRTAEVAQDVEEQRERFFLDLISGAMIGGAIAKKLGFIKFDLEGVRKWALHNMEQLRACRRVSLVTAQDWLQALITGLVGRTVVTLRYSDSRWGEIEYVDERTLRDPVARLATKDQVFLITTKHFNEWCRERRVAPMWLRSELIELGLILQSPGDSKFSLFRGTSVGSIQSRCIELNYNLIYGIGRDPRLKLVPSPEAVAESTSP